jgi:hypothetical protein
MLTGLAKSDNRDYLCHGAFYPAVGGEINAPDGSAAVGPVPAAAVIIPITSIAAIIPPTIAIRAIGLRWSRRGCCCGSGLLNGHIGGPGVERACGV